MRLKMTPRLSLLAALLLLATACGGAADPAAEEAEADEPEEAEEDEPEEAEEDEPEEAEEDASASALQELEDAAKAEGSLMLYLTTTPERAEVVSAAFEEQYGIDTEFFRATTADTQQRYLAEADTGNVIADVINTADPNFFKETLELGILAPLSPNEIPALESWPEDFWRESDIVVSVTPFTLGYNTDLVSPDDLPETWEQWAEENAADSLVVDPSAAAAFVAFWSFMEDTYGSGFLETIREANPALVNSLVPGAQQVAAGQQSFLTPATAVFIENVAEEGGPIAELVLTPTTGAQQSIGISMDAPNPNAARLFMNWIMSEEGQELWLGDTGASPLPGVGTYPLPEGYTPPDIDKAIEERDRILELMGM